jgi:hypothetical protein
MKATIRVRHGMRNIIKKSNSFKSFVNIVVFLSFSSKSLIRCNQLEVFSFKV